MNCASIYLQSVDVPWNLIDVWLTNWPLEETAVIFTQHIEAETKWPPFADDIFKNIFFYENARILIRTSLNFVPKGPIDNIPALVQIMAWRQPSAKSIFEPMMVRSPMHICVTRPQWVDNFLTHIKVRFLEHFLSNLPQVNATRPQWWLVNIGSGKGFRQQAITWTTVDPDLCHHMASLDHNL